jgi:hypothetical protein
MLLQGNLQLVFDALYRMGVIDPILETDWKQSLEDLPFHRDRVTHAVEVVNLCQDDVELMVNRLGNFDSKTLEFLAMEVARELADFHARTTIH